MVEGVEFVIRVSPLTSCSCNMVILFPHIPKLGLSVGFEKSKDTLNSVPVKVSEMFIYNTTLKPQGPPLHVLPHVA